MASKPIRVPKDHCIDFSGRLIEVVVGSEPSVSHSVHENLICAHSEFFKIAMKKEWLEGNQRSVHLQDDDPDIFRIYLQWLYTRTLPTRIDLPGSAGNVEYVQLAKAYVLGDTLQDYDFQDVVIDMIVDKCRFKATDGLKWHPVGEAVQYIYENTLQTSKARSLLVDLYVARGTGDWLHDWMKPDDMPKEFLLDLATNLLDKKHNDPTLKSTLCEYHQHGSEKTHCYQLNNAEDTKTESDSD